MMKIHFIRRSLIGMLALALLLSNAQCKLLRDTGNRTGKSGNTRPAPPTSNKEAKLRSDVVRFAAQYKGTSYKYAGKKPETGFDCSGFTSFVFDHYDIALSPSSSMQSKQGKRKPVEQALPGDLVFFRRSASTDVFHVALVVETAPGELKVIHATTSRGVIVEDVLKSTYWKPYISEVRDVISP